MELSSATLKQALWETLQAAKEQSITPQQSNAVAAQSRAILSTIRLQLQIAKQTQRPVGADTISFAEK
jgi:hypothetical protein